METVIIVFLSVLSFVLFCSGVFSVFQSRSLWRINRDLIENQKNILANNDDILRMFDEMIEREIMMDNEIKYLKDGSQYDYNIEWADDAIYIMSRDREIVSWTEQEWIDEPGVTLGIASAVYTVTVFGPDVLAKSTETEIFCTWAS